MSWSINIVARASEVPAILRQSKYGQLPAHVKDAIERVAEGVANTKDKSDHVPTHVRAVGHGHYGPSDHWNGVTLEVQSVLCEEASVDMPSPDRNTPGTEERADSDPKSLPAVQPPVDDDASRSGV